jgi:hypothetical protein
MHPCYPAPQLPSPSFAAALAAIRTPTAVSSSLLDSIRQEAPSDPTYQDVLRAVTKGARTDFTLHDDLLYTTTNRRLYVTPSLRPTLLQEAHDIPIAGHLGAKKTSARLARHFYWPRLQASAIAHCANCPSCQANKHSTALPAGLLQPLPIPDRPWASVSMDMVSGLPTTPRGHDAFWVFICRLTKLLHVAPCSKAISATATARLFFDNVYRLHGWPQEIVSDRDPRFTSDLWQELTTLTGTKLNMSTANHPQTDGQAENSNKTVLAGLRHYCNAFQDDWDLHLSAVEFAYNDSTHASTNASPFLLTYGHQPSTPASLAADSPSARPPHIADFLTHVAANLARARQSLAKAQTAQATAANRHRRDLTLPVNSFAWVSASHLQPPTAAGARRKLGPKFYGPYRVLKALSPVTYHLDLPPHLKHHPKIHISALKPFTGTANPATFRHPPPPDHVDNEEHFLVEAFLDSRGSGARRRFLVQWAGYAADHNLWVPASHLRQDLDPATFARLEADLAVRRPKSKAPAPPQGDVGVSKPLAPPNSGGASAKPSSSSSARRPTPSAQRPARPCPPAPSVYLRDPLRVTRAHPA